MLVLGGLFRRWLDVDVMESDSSRWVDIDRKVSLLSRHVCSWRFGDVGVDVTPMDAVNAEVGFGRETDDLCG